jgi:guanylate kinase
VTVPFDPSSEPVASANGKTPDQETLGAPGAMLVIISGPSGVGKDTIIDALKRRHRRHAGPRQHDHHFVVTCTTRAPRSGEVDGQSYHFINRDTFMALRDAGELLEWAEVHGQWYGTPRAEVAKYLAKGQDVVLKIDVQGAQKVKERVEDAILIFVVPPSLETLFRRLRSRATESAEELELRQRNAAIELARQGDYDHVVTNEDDQVERTAEIIDEIISTEHAARAERRVSI